MPAPRRSARSVRLRTLQQTSPARVRPRPRARRKAWFGGWRDTPIYDIAQLSPGASLTGPAILEAETTTVVVNDGDRLSVNGLGWLDIALRKG